MNRLVIHPTDRTTDFLRPIYENAGPVSLVTGQCTDNDICDLLSSHTRVIMMGHGTPYGLLSAGQFPRIPHQTVIRDIHAQYLQHTKNNLFIWCHADEYVNYNGIDGFYTGMFISEMSETYSRVRGASQYEIDASNERFSRAIAEAVRGDMSPEQTYKHLERRYANISGNPIVTYNWERMGWS